ncbi:MAG: hypothetical protein WBH14_16285, partial [Albidovulum sp.]
FSVRAAINSALAQPSEWALIASCIVFFCAAEAYHRAWVCRAVPDRFLIRLGDTLAGISAIFMTVALIGFGDIGLAVIAGTMRAVGKFGTAVFPEDYRQNEKCSTLTSVLRILVIASRIPPKLPIFAMCQGDTARDGDNQNNQEWAHTDQAARRPRRNRFPASALSIGGLRPWSQLHCEISNTRVNATVPYYFARKVSPISQRKSRQS